MHLRDRFQVATHVEELPRRAEAVLEQRIADATAARIAAQVHALQLARQRIRARERRDARAAHDFTA